MLCRGMLLSLPRAGRRALGDLGIPSLADPPAPVPTCPGRSAWPSPSGPMSSFGLRTHAFAGNPLRCHHHGEPPPPSSALEYLSALLLGDGRPSSDHKVLPFRKGRPLARSSEAVMPGSSTPAWHLGWLGPSHFGEFPAESFVYLGSGSPEDGGAHYWAVDATDAVGFGFGAGDGDGSNFIELRTLMVATDWGDERTMGELAVAGHAKALLEWHNTSRFCGHCGAMNVPIDAGRRKQCTSDSCKKRIYPRVDPVVIMLVIDKINDCVLLSRQSRYVPRMWSCLAGFIEPGESLEEAVRRETWEETGIEVGEVIYHSSQPWPVGRNSMPCQLMVGFFAYAKSLDIHVDKEELEDARWHSREDVKKGLAFAEYEKAHRSAADKVNQMCMGVEKGQSLSTGFNVETGDLAAMFVPGPYAIAHHLISTWVNQGTSDNLVLTSKKSASWSNL